jgi:hypothetical protein
MLWRWPNRPRLREGGGRSAATVADRPNCGPTEVQNACSMAAGRNSPIRPSCTGSRPKNADDGTQVAGEMPSAHSVYHNSFLGLGMSGEAPEQLAKGGWK